MNGKTEDIVIETGQKQTAILEAAEKLFAQKGYDGTSVRDIAHEANVNVSMISYYFGSKEKMMVSLFAQRINATRIFLEDILNDNSMSHLDKIHKVINIYIDKMIGNKSFHQIILRELTQEISLLEETSIRELIYQTKIKNQEVIKKLIEDGQADGVFIHNIEIPMLVSTIIGTANQVLMNEHFFRRFYNLQESSITDFYNFLKEKIGTHLISLFKTFLIKPH